MSVTTFFEKGKLGSRPMFILLFLQDLKIADMSLLPHSARSQCDITRRYPPHNLRVLTEAKALSL